jgi:predicted RND superfamily exporter protein
LSTGDEQKTVKSAESLGGVQSGAAFSMKNRMGDSLGTLVSMIGLLAILLSTLFFGSFIGILPALAVSVIGLAIVYGIVRAIKARR